MSFLIKKVSLFSLLVFTLFACEEPGDIGLDIKNPGQSFGVQYTDTVTVQTSTVLVDSVRTSLRNGLIIPASNRYLLSGAYTDPQLGNVSATSYFQIYSVTDSILRFGDSPSIDSVVLSLRKNYIYGDTTTAQSLSLYQVENQIDTIRYYNNSSISFSPAILGSAQWRPAPRVTGDTLKIKLDPSVSNQLIALNGQNRPAVREALKGFVLVADPGSNSAVVGFNILSAATRMRVYYRNAASQTQNTFDFILDETRAFNQVTSNRNSPWDMLSMNQPVSSTVTSQETAIEGGGGVMTKIEIPHFQKLKEGKTVRLNQAYIIVQPVQSKTGNTTPPPAELILYRANSSGQPLKTSNGIYVPIEAFSNLNASRAPITSNYNSVDNSYRFDITQYLQQILNSSETISPAMYLTVPSLTLESFYPPTSGRPSYPVIAGSSLENSVSRLILGNQQHPTNSLKLQIYYTEIKQ
ncbi:DUF4270 family protein [Rhodocytophaga aerolata]|uniref:DUF4270 family protein n=1 Tax=Rhodocytophaga aerolata TaxID=455078 RepID=A0ABT8R5Z8_9BACT|nr:DUF4270 family protein [Rhodocytophaga aerolata]MDO1447526.1 DUF4270 family protein [Rhodocytophaga aerolata]